MKTAARLIQTLAHPLVGTERNYDPLLQLVGEAKIVVLGAQTHGTHEFCSERARITRRLIVEKGFQAIALEGDWPDVSRLNAYVRGNGSDPDSNSALSGFTAFPAWLWRNADMLDFVGQLALAPRIVLDILRPVGFEESIDFSGLRRGFFVSPGAGENVH